MYAVVRTGGKQYRVESGAVFEVERLTAEVGSSVELVDVLMIEDGGSLTVGSPAVAGAKVVAEVVEQGRGAKVIVFKYKAKVRYSRRNGHRQAYTRLRVKEILTGEGSGRQAAGAARST